MYSFSRAIFNLGILCFNWKCFILLSALCVPRREHQHMTIKNCLQSPKIRVSFSLEILVNYCHWFQGTWLSADFRHILFEFLIFPKSLELSMQIILENKIEKQAKKYLACQMMKIVHIMIMYQWYRTFSSKIFISF